MDKKSVINLTKSSLRLNEINRLVVKATIEGSIKELFKLLEEHRYLKKLIKIGLIDNSIPKIEYAEAQIIMNQIVSEHVFEADKMLANLENIIGEKLSFNELEAKETDQLQSDLFYSWFSGYEYIQGLYEIGALILDVSVPKILADLVWEARSCYALQKYIALYSLCQTIIEVTIRDICTRKGFIKEKEGDVVIFEQYQKGNIFQLIRQISSGNLKRKIKDIYYNKTCFPIHGQKTVTRQEAKELFRETMTTVQELYARNGY
jgi:hypothetical protein